MQNNIFRTFVIKMNYKYDIILKNDVIIEIIEFNSIIFVVINNAIFLNIEKKKDLNQKKKESNNKKYFDNE